MRITLESSLFPDGPQDIMVRDNMLIKDLIKAVQARYGLPDSYYVVHLNGSKVLAPEKALDQQRVKTGDKLAFSRQQLQASSHSVMKKSGVSPAFLRSEDGHYFGLLRNPAYVGRPKGTQFAAHLLDVDLTPLDPNRSVSRPQARITHDDTKCYFIEGLVDYNPVCLNGKALPYGTRTEIRHGDLLKFGEVVLVFGLRELDRGTTENPNTTDLHE